MKHFWLFSNRLLEVILCRHFTLEIYFTTRGSQSFTDVILLFKEIYLFFLRNYLQDAAIYTVLFNQFIVGLKYKVRWGVQKNQIYLIWFHAFCLQIIDKLSLYLAFKHGIHVFLCEWFRKLSSSIIYNLSNFSSYLLILIYMSIGSILLLKLLVSFRVKVLFMLCPKLFLFKFHVSVWILLLRSDHRVRDFTKLLFFN